MRHRRLQAYLSSRSGQERERRQALRGQESLTELPATRAEARERGLREYFTGRNCSFWNHIAPRFTETAACCECLAVGLRTIDYSKTDEWRKKRRALDAAYRQRRKLKAAHR
jgi:hypothetical protein